MDKRRNKAINGKMNLLFKDRRTKKEKNLDQRLKTMERSEMDSDEEYEAEVNEIESLMYVELDWGEDGPPKSPDRSKKRKLLFGIKKEPKPQVPEHFRGLINLPGTEKNHILEDISPLWVDNVFNPVFVNLVKMKPNQWFPVVVGNAQPKDTQPPPPTLMTSVAVKYQQGD